MTKQRKKAKAFDGPATMEVTLKHADGFIETAIYFLPDHLLAGSVFEVVTDRARRLSDDALMLHGTAAYRHARSHPLPSPGQLPDKSPQKKPRSAADTDLE